MAYLRMIADGVVVLEVVPSSSPVVRVQVSALSLASAPRISPRLILLEVVMDLGPIL